MEDEGDGDRVGQVDGCVEGPDDGDGVGSLVSTKVLGDGGDGADGPGAGGDGGQHQCGDTAVGMEVTYLELSLVQDGEPEEAEDVPLIRTHPWSRRSWMFLGVKRGDRRWR